MSRPLLATVLCALGLALALGRAPAAGASDDAYRQSVEQALAIVSGADTAYAGQAAADAARVLRAGTGSSQIEILDDLDRRPPDLADARRRLASLDEALAGSASPADAARAHRQIQSIIEQHRYDSLRSGRSLVQRLQDLLMELLLRVILFLLARAGTGAGQVIAALIVVLVLALGLWLLLELRRRTRREARPPLPAAVARHVRDHFAEADALAAQGDYRGAVLALAGGVAAAIAGDEAWDRSSLTVRELFRRSPQPERLRPLLLAFEGTSYGERQVGADAYSVAAAAAAGYRGERA